MAREVHDGGSDALEQKVHGGSTVVTIRGFAAGRTSARNRLPNPDPARSPLPFPIGAPRARRPASPHPRRSQ